jgi:hypothetical protein
VEFLLTLLLVVVGLLLLLLSLAGVAFGVYMTLDARTREQGRFFAIWWIPAVAASLGVLMRDLVAFTIGVVCFVVAGVALVLERRSSRKPDRGNRTSPASARKRSSSSRAKRGLLDKIKDYRKSVS